jgi:hypothetical protein
VFKALLRHLLTKCVELLRSLLLRSLTQCVELLRSLLLRSLTPSLLDSRRLQCLLMKSSVRSLNSRLYLEASIALTPRAASHFTLSEASLQGFK